MLNTVQLETFNILSLFLSPVLVRNFYSVDFMSHVNDIHTAYGDLYHMGEIKSSNCASMAALGET